MKRLLLSFLVLALVFCLGGYGGVLWYKQVTAVSDRPLTANVIHSEFEDAVPQTDVRFKEMVEQALADSPNFTIEPALPQVQFVADDDVSAIRREVTDAAIRVSDRFNSPPAQPARISPPPLASDRGANDAWGQDIERFGEPQSAEDAMRSPDLFQANPIRPTPAQVTQQANEAKVVNLMDGMSYLIRVNRKNGTPARQIQMQRQYGGERTIVLDLAEQHSVAELRVFAEAVEVTSEGGEFQLKCEGKVAVVANQSMLWGDGLTLEDGVFKVIEAKVVTPDAIITSGDCEFDFAVGGISVERIAGDESGDKVGEHNAGSDDVGGEVQPSAVGTRATPWIPAESIDVRADNQRNAAIPNFPLESRPSL